MLIDTDILIWYLRGNKHALEIIEKQSTFEISVVTYIELIQGMRNNRELNSCKKALRSWNVRIIQINEIISLKALSYIEQYFLSHSMQLADAQIGATASVYGLPLLTANDKHYKILTKIEINKFRP